jgi:hypothetical protein
MTRTCLPGDPPGLQQTPWSGARPGRRPEPLPRRRQRPSLITLAGLTLGILLWAAPLHPALAVIALQDVPPSITGVDGTVEISADDGVTWSPAESGGHVSSGDLLRTGEDGTCVLAFEDHTMVALKPQTAITMLPKDRALRLELTAGWIWVQFEAVQEGNRNRVLAPYSLVGAGEPTIMTLEFSKDGGTIRVIEGRVDLTTPAGDYLDYAEAGQALPSTKNGSALSYPFDVERERANWEPLLADVTTTSMPDGTSTTEDTGDTGSTITTEGDTSSTGGHTTGTGTLEDGEAHGGWSRAAVILMVVAAILFVALLAVATVLAVLLSRRRKQTAGDILHPAQPPAYGPPPYPGAPPAGTAPPAAAAPAPAAAPAQPTMEPAAFCASCGAPRTPGARFCRTCGKRTGT